MKRRLIFVLILQFLLFHNGIARASSVGTKDLDSDNNDSTDNHSEEDYNDSGDDGDDDEEDDNDDKLSSNNRVTFNTNHSSRRSNDRDTLGYSTARRSSYNPHSRNSYDSRRTSHDSRRSSYSSRSSRDHHDNSRDDSRSYRRILPRRSYDRSDRNRRGSYQPDSREHRDRYTDRRGDRYEDRSGGRYEDRRGGRYEDRRGGRYEDRRGGRYEDRRDRHDWNKNARDDSRESRDQRKTGSRNKIRRAPVLMPSGQTKNITIPTDSKKWRCGERSKLFSLDPNGRTGKVDYAIVKDEMESAWSQKPFTSQIIKIEKVVSTCLWNRYKYRRRQVVDEVKASNERMLFFGAAAPIILELTQKGFDERNLTMQSTSWGAGFILPEHSDQAHGYTSAQADGTRLMLLCRVTLGSTQVFATGATLAHPPVGFQSVKGTVNGQSVYVVYRGEQIYPEYMITYQ